MTLLETVERYFAAISRLDKQAFLDCFSPEGVEHHDPMGTPPHTNQAELGAFWDQIGGLFASVEIRAESVYSAGPDQLALKFVARGQGKNGRAVSFEGIDVIEGDGEGRIRKLCAYWDAGPALQTLMS